MDVVVQLAGDPKDDRHVRLPSLAFLRINHKETKCNTRHVIYRTTNTLYSLGSKLIIVLLCIIFAIHLDVWCV
jgi:hypothetical protein